MISLPAHIKARVNQDEEKARLKISGDIRQVTDQAEGAIANKDSIVSIDFNMPIWVNLIFKQRFIFIQVLP